MLQVLPAFNGGESTFGAYGLIADPDGHSIWAVMDNGGGPEDTETAIIVKIDLNTQLRTASWAYPYPDGSFPGPTIVNNGTPIMWLDAGGRVWTMGGTRPNYHLYQNDPASAFAQLQIVGQRLPNVSDFIPTRLPSDFLYFTFGGKEYAAMAGTVYADVVVINLTDGHVLGNWWSTVGGYTLNGSLFIDGSGHLGWVQPSSGGLLVFTWNPADGTTTQPPPNTNGFVDPYLNNVSFRTAAWSVAAPTVNARGGGLGNLATPRVQYLSAQGYLFVGTSPYNDVRPPVYGIGGDAVLLKFSDLTQVAAVADADPAATFYAPNNGEDAGRFTLQNSKRLGYAQTNLGMPGSGAVGGSGFGNFFRVANPANLVQVSAYDLAAAVRAADPLTSNGYNWAFLWASTHILENYQTGDIVGVASNFNLYRATATSPTGFPSGTPIDPTTDNGSHWLPIHSGDAIPGTPCTYRGVWSAGTTYHLNDVVVRLEFNGQTGCGSSRPSIATATSIGVDPYTASSAFWFPIADSLWSPPTEGGGAVPWGTAGVTRATLPWANVLYYQTRGQIAFTFDFVGSPVYLYSPAPPKGISQLGALTDNGACISSRYVTYGFADALDRERLKMGLDRVIYPYALVNIEGSGGFTLTLLPETILTPYAFTQPAFPLATPALDDQNCPLNVTGNRAFLQIDSSGSCANWQLRRIALAISDDPRIRISGR